MKALFIFSGNRPFKERMVKGALPDTQLYGMNHLEKYGVEARMLDFSYAFPHFSKIAKKIPFYIKQILIFFKADSQQDIIFGSSIFVLVPVKKILRKECKLVLLNISLSRLIRNRKQAILWPFVKWMIRELDGIVCLSEDQKGTLLKDVGFDEKKINVNKLGVDVIFFDKNRVEQNFILSAGRDNGRDYETLIEVARKNPNEEFHVVCSRRNLAGIQNIPDNVKIFFDVDYETLQKKYSSAKMLVICSHPENYTDGADCSGQTVIMEAMASGLPVVMTNRTWANEYFTEGEDFLGVGPYDVAQVEAAIENFANRERRENFAMSAKRKIRSRYSSEHFSKRLAKFFYYLA